MNGLQIGGRERVVLQLARRGRKEGLDHRIALYDTPFRNEELDLDPHEVPVHFVQRGPGLDLRFAMTLARLMRELQVELVHAHNDTAVFYACIAALRLGWRRPAVCGTFHTRPGHDTRGARLLTRWSSVRARRLTAVSQDLASMLVASGWLRRCSVVRNGVDLEEFSPQGPRAVRRDELGVPSGAVLVGHIGRFDPIKRHVDLIRAAELLRESAPRVHVVLVGEGPTKQATVELARNNSNVHFLPRVADVAAFLREIDVFVLCSAHEAMPRVLLEAMACARAIVATRVGGVPEMIGDRPDEPCAVLVPPESPPELAEAIRALADDALRRAELGARARAHVARFSAEREWREYESLYRSALERT